MFYLLPLACSDPGSEVDELRVENKVIQFEYLVSISLGFRAQKHNWIVSKVE